MLSPQTFRRPEDLAGGESRAVASLETGKLPWEGVGEKARPNTRLFYQVVLGTVSFGAAIEQLLSLYTDTRVERPAAKGEAILAAVTIDRNGRLVETPAAALSSFAWGIPHALRGDLTSLAAWRAEEEELTEELDEILRGSGDEEDEPVLDRETILRAYEWLLKRLGLPRQLTAPPRFAIRVYLPFKGFDPPDPLLLNSFFLRDLSAARTLFSEGRATSNLRLYIGERTPASTRDLLDATNVYIITPFVVVADRLRRLVEESGLLVRTKEPRQWIYERIGTVHTVQGREAEAVIFVLGAPAPGQTGARAWAGGRPNLLNVAVTRAQERIYVIGNRELWRQAGVFRELDARLPPSGR